MQIVTRATLNKIKKPTMYHFNMILYKFFFFQILIHTPTVIIMSSKKKRKVKDENRHF